MILLDLPVPADETDLLWQDAYVAYVPSTSGSDCKGCFGFELAYGGCKTKGSILLANSRRSHCGP